MAVTVEIPCRVRVDPESLAHNADDVVSAFSAAITRAIANADREVVQPRRATVVLAAGQPAFRWSGTIRGVPDEARRDLESRLRQAVASAVAAARVTGDASSAVDDAAPPLRDRPAELIDSDRQRSLLWTYTLPSYEGDAEPTDVPIASPRPTSPAMGHQWRLITRPRTNDELRLIVEEAVRQFGPLDASTPRGMIFHEQTPTGTQWTVAIVGSPPSIFSFDRFGTLEYQPRTRTFVPMPGDPTPGPATAEMRSVSDRLGLIDVVDELMGPGIRAQIRTAERRRETTSAPEYEAQVERAAQAEVERRVDEQITLLRGQAMSCVVIVRTGGSFVMLIGTAATAATLHWTGTARLLPVAAEIPLGGGAGGGGNGGEGSRGRGRGGGGDGTGTGAGTGSGTGDGSGDGSGGGTPVRGGFVFDPSAPGSRSDDAEASRFPVIKRGGAGLTCEKMNGEPGLDELGTAGEELRRRIDDLAFRLQITPCYYAANFCIMACRALTQRAADISTYITRSEREGFTRPVPEGTGALGALSFQPVASPAIQFLRHLAGIVPRLHALAMLTLRTYETPEHWPKVHGGWMDSPASWNLHFLHEFTPAIKDAVGEIFISGCQSMLLQLLLSSRQGIQTRITNFDRYAPVFEKLMVSQLSDYAELQRLRDRLRLHGTATWIHTVTDQAGGDVTATLAAANPATAWFTAARSLSSGFLATEAAQTSAGAAGEIVMVGGVAKIRDSHGVLWSEPDIEQALVLQRGEAEGIDPLVKQISDIPDVLIRFARDRSAIRNELWRVLNEMQSNNDEMLGKARASARFAFKASQISEHIPSATIPGTSYALQGIHLQVHEQLGEFFGGNVCYALGIDQLFSSELGMEALTSFGLTIGIVLLSVLCPPLGFAVGVVVAAVEVRHAHERERLYGALLDPELVLTRAEVEIGLFAAYLGLALSLIPEAGTVVGAAARGGRTALRVGMRGGLRAGLRAGSRSAQRFVVRRVTRQIIQAAQRDLLTEFITQVTTALVMEKLMQKVLEPLLSHLEREAMIRGSVGGPQGARFVMAALRQDQRTTSAQVDVRTGGVR